MTLVSDPFTVELVPHRGWDDKATIPDWIDHNQFMVYVHSVGLRHRNADCKLQVGWIGKQSGANFCPTNEFYYFTYPQQQRIAEEAKRKHEERNPIPHTELPPPIPPEPEQIEDDEE